MFFGAITTSPCCFFIFFEATDMIHMARGGCMSRKLFKKQLNSLQSSVSLAFLVENSKSVASLTTPSITSVSPLTTPNNYVIVCWHTKIQVYISAARWPEIAFKGNKQPTFLFSWWGACAKCVLPLYSKQGEQVLKILVQWKETRDDGPIKWEKLH